jgi:hypothetical protein
MPDIANEKGGGQILARRLPQAGVPRAKTGSRRWHVLASGLVAIDNCSLHQNRHAQ